MSIPAGLDLCQFPALQPPDGITSNFENPHSTLRSGLVAVAAVMITWSTIFVLGRVYMNRKRLTMSDYCAILGMLFNGALMGCILSMSKYMRHQWDVRACWFNGDYMKMNFVTQIVMPFAFWFSKAAILFLLLQIFSINKKMRIAIYFGLALNALTYWPNLVLVPVFSVPHQGETWDDLVTSPRVHHMTPIGTEQGSLALLLDLYIFILPLPVLKTLNIKRSKRITLFALFGTGFAGVISGAFGLAFRVKSLHATDLTWANAALYICIVVEVYIALIVSCMPAFAQFTRLHITESAIIQSVVSRLLTSRQSRGSRGDGSNSAGPESGHSQNRRWFGQFNTNKAGKRLGSRETLPNDSEHVLPKSSGGSYDYNATVAMDPIQVKSNGYYTDEYPVQLSPRGGIAVTKTYGLNETAR